MAAERAPFSPNLPAGPDRDALMRVYAKLRAHFGHRRWWPGRTRVEVCIGAILTQNTSWSNVEKAIVRLREAGALSPARILELPDAQLAELIRPSGYYNLKAARLKALMAFFEAQAGQGLRRLERWDTVVLRERLLSIYGVGPETADCILLYALNRPVFVIDAYTRRICHRLGFCAETVTYDEFQALFSSRLEADVPLFNDYHAQFVALGATLCKPRPRCGSCPLQDSCRVGKAGGF